MFAPQLTPEECREKLICWLVNIPLGPELLTEDQGVTGGAQGHGVERNNLGGRGPENRESD